MLDVACHAIVAVLLPARNLDPKVLAHRNTSGRF